MAKDRLIVDDGDGRGFRIVWFLVDAGDIGGALGQGKKEEHTPKALEGLTDPDERESTAAEIAAWQLPEDDKRTHDIYGFSWESKSAAQKALREIKVSMESLLANVPWPEWAIKAKAAGWKPPKGWKP